jgi:hypothetical protein
MLSYPSTISLSSRTLNHLAERIRVHRQQRKSRWRRLAPGRQALLTLAHLRNGDTYTRLAAGFEIGVSTAWRYVQEAVALLSAAADDLNTAMQRIRQLAYAILDGTLIPIDRVADQKPYYCRKHKRHGVNVQVIADAAGRAPRVGLERAARRYARSDRRPHARHHRRADQRRGDDLCR